MRLLETTDGSTYSLTKDFLRNDQVPPYAILSHTWDPDQEVTFEDVVEDSKSKYSKLRASLRLRPRSGKKGYEKLRFCAKQAKRDGLRYFWVDTCCIDKRNLTELQKAINSMFRWYQKATKCYVFLPDVSEASPVGSSNSSSWLSAFTSSPWFTRGWTLQELLAPPVVEFYSREGVCLGDRLQLQQHIHDITDIPLSALRGAPLADFSIDERLSWAEKRVTTVEEDKAYSMLGIFDIHLPLIYGEGYENALERLQEKIAGSQKRTVFDDRKVICGPWSTIPFQHDPNFIPRESLHEIHRIFAGTANYAALVGLGGAGKSQIAIEYTYQAQKRLPSTSIFWVHAETPESFIEGYRKITETVKMEGWNSPQANHMSLVRNWLCDKTNVPWVMVVDNADDESVFSYDIGQNSVSRGSSAILKEPLANFLPHTSSGSIIVTSRSRDVAYRLTGSKSNIVDVGPMNEEEALALLQKKLNFAVAEKEASALISALDAIPLAIAQAAAFISQREPRMSIQKYVAEFGKSDRNRVFLLEKDAGDKRRATQASNSITKTWQISFDYIRNHIPSAARLLSLMSFFDPRSIPESLLEGKYTGDNDEESNFEDDIYTLTSFSLIKPSADGSSFDMHGLVQFSTKRWLEEKGELLHWKETFVSLMDTHYPVSQHGNLSTRKALFPHAQAAISNVPRDEDALEAWASLSFSMASYMADIGHHNQAYKFILDSYDVRRILWGADAPLTLDSLNTLAMILNQLGRYDEAKEMHHKALEAKVRTLGADCRDTLCSMINLASLYNDECQWVDAEKLLLQALETSKRALGPDDLLTLNTMTMLANTYRNQSRWTEAVDLEVKALQARKIQLGPDHPRTLEVKGNLAFTYRKQGRLKEAEELLLEIIKTCEKNPEANIEILTHKSNLASTYKAQGRLDEAEKLQLQVLEKSKEELGPDHFDTVARMSHLTMIYWKQDRYKDAEELESQSLELSISKLGHDHLSTLDSKASLAMIYRSQGLLDKAEMLDIEVLEAHTKKLGDGHPLTLNSKASLAYTHREQGRLHEAAEIEEYILKTRTEMFGPDHLYTLSDMIGLAVTYKRQGRIAEAIELMDRCFEGHQRILGAEHETTVGCREALERWRKIEVKQ